MNLKPIEKMNYFHIAEKLVDILMTKTQNNDPLFFRVIVAYYLTTLASQMRVSIKGFSRGTIPINTYVIALSPSGSGKGHSTSLIEQEVLNNFNAIFREQTLRYSAEQNCERLAQKRATRNNTDFQSELEKLGRDYQNLGAYLPSFDSATTPAIKQMRQKLLMADAGSCNLVIDEFGANLTGSIEPLTTYLELYDKGLLRDKLVKSSAENVRFERIEGYTPANLLAFGTAANLLDGSRNEETLHGLLKIGYARRCLFAYADKVNKNQVSSVDDAIAQMFNNDDDDHLEELSEDFSLLADMSLLNKYISITDASLRTLVAYKLSCEEQSQHIPEAEEIRKSELEHRYFKVLKLAGAYAFVDSSDEITTDHIEAAIKLVEDSGEAFAKLMTPMKPYMKLAKYLADVRAEVTLADLDEDVPYFKGTKTMKDELIQMATAWGYKNNIMIKKSFMDSIMFLSADSLQETNLDELVVSWTNSTNMTSNYRNEVAPFDKLSKLFTAKGFHWLNHHVSDGYRKEENAIKGFNLLVLDVDGTCNLSTAKMLLKDYKAIYYTTKSHTATDNRFRIILPTNYTLKLDAKDYKEFYNNVLKDIPFEVDEQASHRVKKWLSNPDAIYETTEGILFDVLPYVPKSAKNDERERQLKDQSQLDNLERWVMNNTGDGNRNNMLLRYAMLLADSGFSFQDIKDKTIKLNDKLADKLSEIELSSTIFHTLANKLVAMGKSVV